MKANEAPEKIYIHEASAPELTEKLPYHLEYVRKDAFIEKAKEFLWAHTPGTDYHVNYIVKRFEKYMEE